MRNIFTCNTRGTHAQERTGVITTSHGKVETPTFMAVATYGVVRGISAQDLLKLGASIVLANTYHLHERPGEGTVKSLGGLHGFTGWVGPWLTDSGGFQVTSLASKVAISEEGVLFQSPFDGKRRELTPESTVKIQEELGSDISMVLDHCIPVADRGAGTPPRALVREAMERTIQWARRSMAVPRPPDQSLFGIVQGGDDPTLRRESAEATVSLEFDGYAHGGLGLGENVSLRDEILEETNEIIPPDKPRYLMGIGRPSDIIRAVSRGIDMFDCVLPTRHGRHGVVFTSEGRVNLKAARFSSSEAPPDSRCSCQTCLHHSRAYLRHLFRVGDQLAGRLATIHNLHYYFQLMADIRKSINEGSFKAFAEGRLAVTE